MRILLTSTRGQGHMRPLLPFAKGLMDRGHEVAIASPEDTRPIADKVGVPLLPFERMSDEEINAQWADRQHLGDEEMARVAIQEMFANRTARRAIPKLDEALNSWRPDIVVRDSSEFAAFVLCEKYGIPHARMGVHNCEVEEMLLRLAVEPVDGLLSDLGAGTQDGDGLWSEPAFSMFPAGFDGDAAHGADNPPMRINFAKDAVAPEADWAPETDMPLVYITFGTITGGDLMGYAEVYEMALEATSGLDIEVLMTTGPNIDPESLGPARRNAQVRSFVPQAAVLHRAAAVIHHGGSGTLLGCFEAGVPMVVVPLFADQPWNASRVEAAGLGRSVTEHSDTTLRAALNDVMSDAAYADRGRVIAAEMAELPGAVAALDRIENLARSK